MDPIVTPQIKQVQVRAPPRLHIPPVRPPPQSNLEADLQQAELQQYVDLHQHAQARYMHLATKCIPKAALDHDEGDTWFRFHQAMFHSTNPSPATLAHHLRIRQPLRSDWAEAFQCPQLRQSLIAYNRLDPIQTIKDVDNFISELQR